jgi:predicted GNAT family N-acyltransferase
MRFHLTLDNWPAQCVDARTVRTEVFIVEQQVPVELEWDEMDRDCLHAIAYDDAGAPIGTGRLLPDGHIGRMAVKKSVRGGGIGSAILAALMQAAQQRGDHEVILNAQIQAESFYARFEFVREGDVFMDAGIPHICMRHVFGYLTVQLILTGINCVFFRLTALFVIA